jgi:hypothetical protein
MRDGKNELDNLATLKEPLKMTGDREVLTRAKGLYKGGYLDTMKDFSWAFLSPTQGH